MNVLYLIIGMAVLMVSAMIWIRATKDEQDF